MNQDRAKLVQLRDAAGEELSDRGLVAACAAGDRTARARLFERHVDVVHRTIARMRGSDPHAIEDLVQATFLAAFAGAARFRGERAKPWLLGIAVNQVREYARKEIRRKRAFERVAETAPSATAMPSLAAARLPDAIAQLPIDLRAAFVLVDLEDERGVDAAATLGIPEGTLWRRVFEARKALRALIGGAS